MPKGKRAAHAARHDLGWALSQLGHAFPATRHGFAQGWHTSREAHHQAMLGRQEAKTRHLETKAGLIPQLAEYRERQRAALEQIRSGKAPGTPETVTAGTPMAPEEGTPEGSSSRQFPVKLTATSKSGRVLDPITGAATGTAIVRTEEDLQRRLEAAAQDPDIDVSVDPLAEADDEPASPGDTTVTEDDWNAPLPGEEGSAAPEEGTPEGTSPASTASTEGEQVAKGTLPSGQQVLQAGTMEVRDGQLHASGWVFGSKGDLPEGDLTGGQSMSKADVAAMHTMAHGADCTCGIPRSQQASTSQSPSTEGTTMAEADTSYDQIQADMNRDHDHAEQAAAEQQQAAAAQENAAAAAQQALAQTNATTDAASGLDLDAESLGALMDHSEAQKIAEQAHQGALEAAQAAQSANVRVQETAQNVQAVLSKNHGQLSEAHKEAPVEAAEKPFYAA
jgi:hypothetical protein